MESQLEVTSAQAALEQFKVEAEAARVANELVCMLAEKCNVVRCRPRSTLCIGYHGLCCFDCQKAQQLQAESSASLLQQEDTLQRQRDADLLALQEQSAQRREEARLASERKLQDERLQHERDLQKQRLEAETEGKLRLEVWRCRIHSSMSWSAVKCALPLSPQRGRDMMLACVLMPSSA